MADAPDDFEQQAIARLERELELVKAQAAKRLREQNAALMSASQWARSTAPRSPAPAGRWPRSPPPPSSPPAAACTVPSVAARSPSAAGTGQRDRRRHPRARLAFGALQLAAPPRDAGPVLFEASTETLNRYGFKLAHSHWRIANYQRNPVVGWNHDMSRPPIGRARAELDGFNRTLRAAVEFDRGDSFAADIERKVRGGFLNAVSVGWDFIREDGSPVLEWWRLKPSQIERDVWYDLTEISVVPVPGDPAAVRVGQSLGDAGAVTADGAARLLTAITLPDAPVVVGRLVRQVLAERARPAERLAWFPPPPASPAVVRGPYA